MTKKNLFYIFTGLNILDAILTIIILELGGIELNPIMDYIMQQSSYSGMIALKAIVLILIFKSLNTLSKESLFVLIAAFTLIVINNTFSVFFLLA